MSEPNHTWENNNNRAQTGRRRPGQESSPTSGVWTVRGGGAIWHASYSLLRGDRVQNEEQFRIFDCARTLWYCSVWTKTSINIHLSTYQARPNSTFSVWTLVLCRNKAHTLPYFLTTLYRQDYQKSRIVLYFKVDNSQVVDQVYLGFVILYLIQGWEYRGPREMVEWNAS